MTDTQLVIATLLPLFVITIVAAVYALELVLDRVQQILGRPLDKLEERLFAIETSLREANRYQERLIACVGRIAERR